MKYSDHGSAHTGKSAHTASEIILLTLLLFSSGLTQECSQLIAEGDSFYADFDNARALQLYQQAYRQCPESFEAITKTGQLLNDRGLELTGDSAVYYYSRALELSETMIAKYPDSAQSYFFRSYSAGNLARASSGRKKVRMSRVVVENAEKSISLDSNYSRPYVVLGGYYREVATASSFLKFLARILFGSVPDGTLEDSERVLLQALEIDPENIYAHFELGKTYMQMDRPDRARIHLERVLELPAQNYYGQVMQRKSRELLDDLG